jgi:hypothetical protein
LFGGPGLFGQFILGKKVEINGEVLIAPPVDDFSVE